MVRLEEYELERQVVETGHPIAVPFEMNRMADGTLDLLVYSFCESTAREFEKRFFDNPTGEDAKSFLYERIAPVMREMEYDCDGALERIYYEFRAESVNDIVGDIHSDCELTDDLSGEEFVNLPLDEFEFLETDPCDKMAIIRRDGRVVCYAGLNDVCENDGCYEITVECEEKYRGNGYARSCVALLTRHILSHGERVKYICTSDNIASIKTAKSIGFKEYRTCMPFVCFRDSDEAEQF